jgi:hypothetical protein
MNTLPRVYHSEICEGGLEHSSLQTPDSIIASLRLSPPAKRRLAMRHADSLGQPLKDQEDNRTHPGVPGPSRVGCAVFRARGFGGSGLELNHQLQLAPVRGRNCTLMLRNHRQRGPAAPVGAQGIWQRNVGSTAAPTLVLSIYPSTKAPHQTLPLGLVLFHTTQQSDADVTGWPAKPQAMTLMGSPLGLAMQMAPGISCTSCRVLAYSAGGTRMHNPHARHCREAECTVLSNRVPELGS